MCAIPQSHQMSHRHNALVIALYGAIAIVPPPRMESIDFVDTPDGGSLMVSIIARFGHNVLLTGFAFLTIAFVLQMI
jgi:hypothetical protein